MISQNRLISDLMCFLLYATIVMEYGKSGWQSIENFYSKV